MQGYPKNTPPNKFGGATPARHGHQYDITHPQRSRQLHIVSFLYRCYNLILIKELIIKIYTLSRRLANILNFII